jgi:hypothetical protein
MSESDRIANMKRRTVFAFNRDKPPHKSTVLQSQETLNTIAGGAVDSAPFVFSSQVNTFQSNLQAALDAIFLKLAADNVGPTRTSRILYIWFATLAHAWNWVTRSAPFEGVRDGWDWSQRTQLAAVPEQTAWMTAVLQTVMPVFVPGFNAASILIADQAAFGWTAPDQAELTAQIKVRGNWSAWHTAWQTWYSSRQGDGSIAASAVPDAVSAYPNGTTRLDVAATVDPASYAHPESWTPLKIGTKQQNYLTLNWLDVRSAVLTTDDESELFSLAATYYPNTTQRTQEIEELVGITASLTDAQKVTAEFWAGGPFTVSPPGMCVWLWKEYMRSFSHTNNTWIYSGYDLAQHIFETGRIVWGLKKLYMQARPIQEIRRVYRGQTLIKYDGTPIAGESWVPYQETEFVTPPFADFPSGHSAFSQSFANVMTSWFGSRIQETERVLFPDLNLLSPAFQKAQINKYCTFVFPAGESLIQHRSVPAADVTLHWSTWQELADSAGLSRKYGGIHATSAHVGSQAVANRLHTILKSYYKLG